ncbi:MAG: hypothetical protein ACE5F6_03940 [Anaerolineae bacterium]
MSGWGDGAGTGKHIVVWDFTRKPSATFYRMLGDEFGISAGAPEYVQRSTLIVRDGFQAYGIAALVEEFGGTVLVYAVVENPDGAQLMAEARGRIAEARRRRRSRKRA